MAAQARRKESELKSSDAERPWLGILGLLLFACLLRGALRYRLPADEMARLYQAGFARNAVALLPLARLSGSERSVLERRLQRAVAVSAHDPERLRAVPPYPLTGDGRFWPSIGELVPAATWRLRWDGEESGELSVAPEGAPAWKVPLRSRDLVRPDWSPFSGLVAYYDLGRVWIADVRGRRFQSLVQEPLLDRGGAIRFSADGTAVAFYFHEDGRWLSQDLYVLVERP